MFEQYRIIHFVGIGGIGMSGIAEVLKNLGYEVTGSDIKKSATIDRLNSTGIKVHIGHHEGNVDNAHVVVVSSAVRDDNPEILEAKRRSIPVIPRAEMLAELGRLKYSILIAGSHGKTTTTSLISTILSHSGIDPTVVIGGRLTATNSNSILGYGNYFVAEADESDGSFIKLNPTIAVATNIDREHLDYFGSFYRLKGAFISFLNKIPFYGLSVLCNEDEHIREIMPELTRRYTTYGLSDDSDYYATGITTGFMSAEFDFFYRDELLGHFLIPLSGTHNILNTLASIVVSQALRIEIKEVQDSLSRFKGIRRRCEYKGETRGIKVFDDYGHHPREIQMTLRGVRNGNSHMNRLIVVFQPHRYTRVRDLLEDFSNSFGDADKVYVTDIYPAGEKPIDGITSPKLCERMRKKGTPVVYEEDTTRLVTMLQNECREGDLIITFGAGDVWKIGEEFLRLSVN